MSTQRLVRHLDRLQYLVVGLAVAVVPLVFYVGNQNIVILKPVLAQALALVAFGLWMVESVERGRFRLAATPLNGPLVAYFLWVIGTVVLSSQFWYFSLEELGRYLAVFLLFFLIVKLVRSRFRLTVLLWILFGVSFITSVYGLLQYHDMGLINWGQSVLISSFGNKNFFAGYLVLTTPLVFGGFLAFSKTPTRILLGGLGLFQIYMLLATGTRTGFLGLLSGGGLFGVLLLFHHGQGQSSAVRRRILLGGGAAIVVLGLVVYSAVPSHLSRRLGEAFDLQQGTGRVRWIMWTGSSRAAEDAPILGHGHGVFQQVFPYYRPTFYHRFRVSHNTRHSHNEYLEILMETGTVGLALYLLLMAVTALVLYRFLKRHRGRFYPYIVIGSSGGIAGSLGQNFASVNMRWMSSTLTFWFLMALLFAAVRLGCGAASRDEPASAAEAPDRGRFGGGWRTVAHGTVVLGLLGAGYGLYCTVQADLWLNRLNGYISLASRRGGYWRLAARAGETSLDYNPYSLSTRYKLGYVYLNQRRYRAANRVYGNLTSLAPNYAQIHNNIAIIHRQMDRPYRSLLHFEWATLLEDNVRNHFNLMERYTRSGRPDRAHYHALAVPRIQLEEMRDHVHVQSVRLADRNFETARNKMAQRRELTSQLQRGLSYLQRSSPRSEVNLPAHYGLRLALNVPDPDRLARLLVGEKSPRVSGPVFLAAVGRWRGGTSDEIGVARERLVEWLEPRADTEDPLLTLALAELYAQQGRAARSRRTLERVRERLPQHPRVGESLGFLRAQLRTGGRSRG